MLNVQSLVRFSALGFSAIALIWGCAAGDIDTPDNSTASSAGVGGEGGISDSGGMGGAGGENLCEQDCSNIMTPTCLISVCNDGSYQGEIGKCVVVPVEDGMPCDDELYCTVDDSCVAGVCTGGPQNDCGLELTECEEAVCDEVSKGCTAEPANDGDPCVNEDLCIINSACQGGTCAGGQYNNCLFAPVPNDCHVAICNPMTGICDAQPGNDGELCTDLTDLCTENKTCTAGQCVGGTSKDCSNLSVGCDVGICDATNGQCTTMSAGEGQVCDDMDACTTGEVCTMGTCGGGSPVTVCSQTPDGCCPSVCTPQDDYDCACPGTYINGVCVYLDNPAASYPLAGAQAECQAMGVGWDLCSPTMLCDPMMYSYLSGEGCDCGGGSTACACGSAANVYVHVSGGTSPYYIRAPEIPNCGAAACTNSVSETCGVALCCRP